MVKQSSNHVGQEHILVNNLQFFLIYGGASPFTVLKFNQSFMLNYFANQIQPKSPPDKFRHIWAWLGTAGHSQPTVAVSDAIFLVPISI